MSQQGNSGSQERLHNVDDVEELPHATDRDHMFEAWCSQHHCHPDTCWEQHPAWVAFNSRFPNIASQSLQGTTGREMKPSPMAEEFANRPMRRELNG